MEYHNQSEDNIHASAAALELLRYILGDKDARLTEQTYTAALNEHRERTQQLDRLLEKMVHLKLQLQQCDSTQVLERKSQESSIASLESTVNLLKSLAREDEKRHLRDAVRISELNRQLEEQANELAEKDECISKLTALKPQHEASRLGELRNRRNSIESDMISKVNKLTDTVGDAKSQHDLVGTITSLSEASCKLDDLSSATPKERTLEENEDIERLRWKLWQSEKERAFESEQADKVRRKNEEQLEHLRKVLNKSKCAIDRLLSSMNGFIGTVEPQHGENQQRDSSLDPEKTPSDTRDYPDSVVVDKKLISDNTKQTRTRSSKLRQRVGQLEKLVDVMDSINKELQLKLEQSNSAERRSSVEQLASELADLQHQLSQTELLNYNRRVGVEPEETIDVYNLHSQLSETEKQCRAMKQIIKEQEMHIIFLDHQIVHLNEELRLAESRENELARRVEEMEVEDHEFKLILEDVQIKFFEVEQKNVEIEKKLVDARRSLEEAYFNIKELEIRTGCATGAEEKIKQANPELVELKTNLTAASAAKSDSINTGKLDAAMLESVVHDLQDQLAFMDEKNVSLERSLKVTEMRLAEAKSNVSVLESQNLFFESDDDFNNEVAFVKQDNVKKEIELHEQQNEIIALKEEIEQLRNENKGSRNEIQSLHSRSNIVFAEHQSVENERLKADVDGYQAAITASSSSMLVSQNSMLEFHQSIESLKLEADQLTKLVYEKNYQLVKLRGRLKDTDEQYPNALQQQEEDESGFKNLHLECFHDQSRCSHEKIDAGDMLKEEIRVKDLRIEELARNLEETLALLIQISQKRDPEIESLRNELADNRPTIAEANFNESSRTGKEMQGSEPRISSRVFNEVRSDVQHAETFDALKHELDEVNLKVRQSEERCNKLEILLDQKRGDTIDHQNLQLLLSEMTKENARLADQLVVAETRVKEADELMQLQHDLIFKIDSLQEELLALKTIYASLERCGSLEKPDSSAVNECQKEVL